MDAEQWIYAAIDQVEALTSRASADLAQALGQPPPFVVVSVVASSPLGSLDRFGDAHVHFRVDLWARTPEQRSELDRELQRKLACPGFHLAGDERLLSISGRQHLSQEDTDTGLVRGAGQAYRVVRTYTVLE